MCSCFGPRTNSPRCWYPGLKSYKPIRLQMEVLARKKAEHENAAL